MRTISRITRAEHELRRAAVVTGRPREGDRQWEERWARWLETARPEQLWPGGDWQAWLYLGGRGAGKTAALAHATAAAALDGRAQRIAVIARTADDLRNVSIAALQAAVGPGLHYYPSNHHKLVFPGGATAFGFSAARPDSLRGHQFDLAWVDEAAAFPDPDLFDQLSLALRAPGARLIISTTPRPTKFIRDLVADPSTVVTRSRTWDNAAHLDPAALASYAKYAGTRIGRQELEGEILEDLAGGLWLPSWIDENRVARPPELVRTVVAVDPAVGSGRGSHEVGIIVAAKGVDSHAYILADHSGHIGPDEWGRRAAHTARFWGADTLVVEPNNGGDLIRSVIESVDATLPYKAIRSSASKLVRAQPIAAWYELGNVHHVDRFERLEEQLVGANLEHGTGPNDRLDALVLALTELDLGASAVGGPEAEDYARSVWLCVCGHRFGWDPGRRCPKCGTPSAATYDAPINRRSSS